MHCLRAMQRGGYAPVRSLLCVLWLFFGLVRPAIGQIAWANWTSATAGNPGSAAGTITVSGSSPISITYNGEIFFAQTNGVGTDFYIPPNPYTSATVPNAPPDSDIIALIGGNNTVNTLTFSEPVVNPVIAIVSLGDPSDPIFYNFSAPFTILSDGPGWWGGPGTLLTQPNNVLEGIEGDGTIQFNGTFSSISWTVPDAENWHGFTVGIQGLGSLSVPEPGNIALLAVSGLSGMGFFLRHRRR